MCGSWPGAMGGPSLWTATVTTSPWPASLEVHGPVGRAVVERVRQEVADGLANAVGIPFSAKVPRLAHDRAARARGLGGLDHRPRDVPKVGGPRRDRDAAAEAAAREIQQVGDHARHAVDVGDDELRRAAERGRELRRLELPLGRQADGVERTA